MDMQKMEQSQNAMNRLNNAVEELIKIVQQQKTEFYTRLSETQNLLQTAENKAAVLEAQVQTLNNENQKLKIDLIAAQNNSENDEKIKSLQNDLELKANKINGLQTEVQNLNNALSNRKNQIEELNDKNNELSEKMQQMQQTVSQTTADIDNVIARLEKAAKENGTSNNNN